MWTRALAVVACLSLLGCGAVRMDQPGPDGGNAGVDAGEAFPIDLTDWEGVATPDDLRFLREIAKASLGEAADLDGDGVSEVTAVRLEDGTTRWDFDVLNDDWPLMTAERLPSGKVTFAFRLNQTSQINAVHTYDGPVTTFEWNDNLRANWFSDRETHTVDGVAGVVSVRHESRTSASANWQLVEEYTSSTTVEQVGPAESCSWPPSRVVIDGYQRPPMGVGIAWHDGAGYACSETDKKQIQRAFLCAMQKARDGCLSKRNRVLAEKLIGLFVARRMTFLVTCEGSTCGSSFLGQTVLSPEVVPGGLLAPIRLNLESLRNPSARWTDNEETEFCKTMLHELLHHVVGPGAPGHENGLNGEIVFKDKVFACSIYCAADCGSRLRNELVRSDASVVRSGSLCAACAGTPDEQRECGYEDITRISGVMCPNLDLCHGSIGVNRTCSVCGDVGFVDCLGQETEPRQFNCCAECPADAPKNDMPCGGYVARSAPGCDDPPECRTATP